MTPLSGEWQGPRGWRVPVRGIRRGCIKHPKGSLWSSAWCCGGHGQVTESGASVSSSVKGGPCNSRLTWLSVPHSWACAFVTSPSLGPWPSKEWHSKELAFSDTTQDTARQARHADFLISHPRPSHGGPFAHERAEADGGNGGQPKSLSCRWGRSSQAGRLAPGPANLPTTLATGAAQSWLGKSAQPGLWRELNTQRS